MLQLFLAHFGQCFGRAIGKCVEQFGNQFVHRLIQHAQVNGRFGHQFFSFLQFLPCLHGTENDPAILVGKAVKHHKGVGDKTAIYFQHGRDVGNQA